MTMSAPRASAVRARTAATVSSAGDDLDDFGCSEEARGGDLVVAFDDGDYAQSAQAGDVA